MENPIPKIFQLIKSTLIEKDGDGPIYGSIKRWVAWLLLYCIVAQVLVSLMPDGAIHIGAFLNATWTHKGAAVDMNVLNALLHTIEIMVLGGAGISALSNTTQNYHNLKYGPQNNSPDNNPTGQNTQPTQ